MFSYKLNIPKALAEAGYGPARLRRERLLGDRTLALLKQNESVTMETLARCCLLLGCTMDDLVAVMPSEEEAEYLQQNEIMEKDGAVYRRIQAGKKDGTSFFYQVFYREFRKIDCVPEVGKRLRIEKLCPEVVVSAEELVPVEETMPGTGNFHEIPGLRTFRVETEKRKKGTTWENNMAGKETVVHNTRYLYTETGEGQEHGRP